jgi:hypothetical protein
MEWYGEEIREESVTYHRAMRPSLGVGAERVGL